MVRIPNPTTASEQVPLKLEDTLYVFEFYWNTTDESWMLNVLDSAFNDLVTGIRLVLDQDLLHAFRSYGVPKGNLVIVDPSSMEPIGRYDFESDRDLQILYIEENEER